MSGPISRETRRELLEALRQRYREASKQEKTRILDEFVELAQCHRKHAVRLLRESGAERQSVKPAGIGQRVYDDAVREALVVVWEASDRICGKRLVAILPNLVEAMERHGHLDLDPHVRERLLRISAASIDRLLRPIRGHAGRRRSRRRGKHKINRRVPVRTFDDWQAPVPGYLEIDLVAHCGGVMSGAFIHSLVATDVASGWTEAVALLAREQSLVVAGLEGIDCQLPVPMRGIDSDNDGAFINETLIEHCANAQLEFTRSRAYRKNDQAWIEQKNGSVVRRFVGYERYAGALAAHALTQLYALVRLYVNFFQPSFKLLSKHREGAKVVKRYDRPATPCERLLADSRVDPEIKAALRERRAVLDPLSLLHRIREAQGALAALASPETAGAPARESLEQFLASLPTLWRAGEVRPTHAPKAKRKRTWRTREDPFEGVWSEILLWLQHEPEVTAKELFERLQKLHPGQFSDGQLRTLQRRIREWRAVMARQLVYGIIDHAGRRDGTTMAGTGTRP